MVFHKTDMKYDKYKTGVSIRKIIFTGLFNNLLKKLFT
jgi:hypothetical protein